ncbi:MAG: nitrilase-related carbon-nitrogen hydrolase [Burkholderiaceae bacterium]|nr:nitrilase-related carbon-nitrogen hydrolase [Burkholderiaceae bacterium]
MICYLLVMPQINCTVGDIEGNSKRILEMAGQAAAAGADLLLTPELSLTGYPPEDLLLRPVISTSGHRAIDRARRASGCRCPNAP